MKSFITMTTIVAGLMLSGAAVGDTIYVAQDGSGDYTSIQGAIDGSSDGDTILIDAGTYFEHSLNPDGRAIAIIGATNSDGTPAVTIDAQQQHVVFIFQSGEGPGTRIENLVIQGGKSSSGGGGIDCYKNSSPTIQACVITGNETEYNGGGIWCWSGCNPIITGCTISGNSAGSSGGGIYCYLSSPTLIDCRIMGNTSNWHGGGCYASGGSIMLSGTEVSGNTAAGSIAEGAGLWCDDSTVDLDSCVITGNQGNDDGGGVQMRACTFTIDHCEISQNSSGWGAGLFVTQSTGTVWATTIAGNTATHQGGALYCGSGSTVELSGCVIRDNCAASGGVAYTTGSTSVASSILCGNCEPTEAGNAIADLGGNQFLEDCPALGACCINSSCLAERPETDCLLYGGTWLGEGTSCLQCPDPELPGACCVNGLCAPLSAADCFNVEGLYAGDGVACGDADCPAVCPGDVSGDGQVGIVDLLTIIDGWGFCP